MTRTAGFALTVWLLFTGLSYGHNPDTSYLRCVVTPHELSLRFSFDLATLYRVVGFDVNASGQVSRESMEKLSGIVYDYLEQSVLLDINGHRTRLGQKQPMGWPLEAGEAILEKNYRDYLLNFSFTCPTDAVIEDITFDYEVFTQLGSQHRAIADIEQEGRHLQVDFTDVEPDYLYDTGWTAKPISASAPEAFRKGVTLAWLHLEWPIIAFFAMLFSKLRGSWRLAQLAAMSLIETGVIYACQDLKLNSPGWAGVSIGLALAALVSWTTAAMLRRPFKPPIPPLQ